MIGKVGDVPVAAMQGRVHLYEGYSIEGSHVPDARFLAAGNSRGDPDQCGRRHQSRITSQGALVVIRDHINLQGTNPLIGPNDERFGPRFPDMTEAYSKDIAKSRWREAKRLGIADPRRRVCGAFRAQL